MPVGVVAKPFGDRMEARNTLRHRDGACLDFRPFDRIFQPDLCLTVDVASGQALAGRHLVEPLCGEHSLLIVGFALSAPTWNPQRTAGRDDVGHELLGR